MVKLFHCRKNIFSKFQDVCYHTMHSVISSIVSILKTSERCKSKILYCQYCIGNTARIVYNKDKFTNSKPLLKNLNALNVYQINIYQHLGFMHKFNNNETPKVFNNIIKRPEHRYPTNFSSLNFSLKSYSLNNTKYSISFRGPKLWNDIPNKQEKEIQSFPLFQKKMKIKLLESENETVCF